MNISSLASTGSFYASITSQGRSAGASASGTASTAQSGQALTTEQQQQIQKLKQRDRQVRQHEQAHMSAGAGMITSSASFTYQKGPDGVNYAVGGEVGISTSPGRTPDETIQRAQQIRSAALAPADPSAQDRTVAAKASQMEQQAQLEKSRQTNDAENSMTKPDASTINRAYSSTAEDSTSGFSTYA